MYTIKIGLISLTFASVTLMTLCYYFSSTYCPTLNRSMKPMYISRKLIPVINQSDSLNISKRIHLDEPPSAKDFTSVKFQAENKFKSNNTPAVTFIPKGNQAANNLTTTQNPDPFACLKRTDNRHLNISNVDDLKVRYDKTIFFLETSCKARVAGHVALSGRQACAVESAARIHPGMDVLVLVLAPVPLGTNRLVQAITESYENVRVVNANIESYMLGTPVESLYRSGQLQKSQWSMIHLSDVLRYVTLWKYGGMYMDLDVLITKNLEDLGPNFTGLEDKNSIAAGVLGFESSHNGHEWVEKILTDINKHYRPDEWAYNSIGVLENLLVEICGTQQAANMTTDRCQGYVVLPTDVFYPVPYYKWQYYFDNQHRNQVLQIVNGNVTRAIHVWNKLSAEKQPDKNSAYRLLAKKYCPQVYKLSVDIF